MIPADIPPVLVPLVVIEKGIDFGPYDAGGAFTLAAPDTGWTAARYGTSSAPRYSRECARSIGSPWRVHTDAKGIDRALTETSPTVSPKDVPGQLADLKRLTGYGWARLGDLLGCTRQALHGWTLGAPITDVNRDKLASLLATVSFIDRGSAEENRQLLDSSLHGITLVQMLSEGRFNDVRRLAGAGPGRQDASWLPTTRAEPAPEDHWFARIIGSGSEAEENVTIRAKPGGKKRLRLKKG